MNTFISLLLAGAGIYFLFLSYRMYIKGWKVSTSLCVIVGVVTILGAQDWVQGFLKTEVVQLLYSYSAKINSYHKTVGELEVKVREHQNKLDVHQRELDEQQKRIILTQGIISNQQSSMAHQANLIIQQELTIKTQTIEVLKAQRDVVETGCKVSEQQRQIDNVDYLVKNLFNNTITEEIQGADTNRILIISHGEGACIIGIKLKYSALPKSVHGVYNSMSFMPSPAQFRNIITAIGVGKKEQWNTGRYYFTYVVDTRETNLVENMLTSEHDKPCCKTVLLSSATNDPALIKLQISSDLK